MSILLSVLSLFLLNHNTSTETIADYTGSWEYEVESPDITYKGIMEINKEDGEYSGALVSEGAEYEMSEISIEGNVLTFKITVEGYPCDIKGTFEGNSFAGTVSVEGYQLPITAKRLE